jgi:hypothetical protein
MSTPSDPIPASLPPPPRRLRIVDYLGVFFGIIGVVGLVLAYYWHAQSVQERVPMYYVSPTRARIVDTSVPAPPQLQVLYKGKDLNANVSSAVVYFWNDGKLPIKPEDILEPVKIELDPKCEIIDARILGVSRAVTKFATGNVSETAKNSLPLSFSILERNDGAAVQIIYSGKPDTTVSLNGTILGAGWPRLAAPGERNSEVETAARMRKTLLNASLVLTGLGGAIFGWFFDIGRLRPASTGSRRPLSLTLAMIGVSVVLWVCAWVVGRPARLPLSPVPNSISVRK